MSKFVKVIAGAAIIAVGAITGNPQLVMLGVSTFIAGVSSLLKGGPKPRMAQGAQVQVGEVPREGIFGRSAVAGSLVDAFNYGGKYGTDWTVMVFAVADHECDALEGFYVYNNFVSFAGDGMVAGYNNQLQVYWRPGAWADAVPAVLTTNAPLFPSGHPLAGTRTWTSADRGRGVAKVVVAYKADDPEAKNPVWTSGLPNFLWLVRGLKCYDPRADSTVGGSGAQRWADDSTRVWSENLAVCRYTWARGIYAPGQVDNPAMLMLGRGLSAFEAPPENQFAPANLCAEAVALDVGGTEPRYRVGGRFGGDDAFIDTENDLAAACGGVIVEREGSVELLPGAAETPVATITDADLVQGSTVSQRDFKLKTDAEWVNGVAASYIEPTQKWGSHSTPVRRDLADIAADGEPRTATPQLALVTSGTQAQRIAEQLRRKGRLWAMRKAVLPPRLAGLQHGDWIVWTSQRYFKRPGAPGDSTVYRIVSDESKADWHNSLVLEEIAASVFSPVSETGSGAVAVDNPALPSSGDPDDANWTLSAETLVGGSGTVHALRFNGDSSDDSAAVTVLFEYAAASSAPDPDDDAVWTSGASRAASATAAASDIAGVAADTEYWGAVRYLTRFGRPTGRLVLGPVTTGARDGAAMELVSKTVQFPLSSDDDQIDVAAFVGVPSSGISISFPADSLTGLSAGTPYGVFWDTVSADYLAAISPAATQWANPALVFIGYQSTSSGGVHPPAEDPPPGSGGGRGGDNPLL